MNSLLMRSGIAALLLGTLLSTGLLVSNRTPLRTSAASLPATAELPAPADESFGSVSPQLREYVYYPSGGFYFAPRTRTWFWQQDGGWRYGLSLPERFWDASGDGVNIRLESDLPYLEHEKVFAHYANLRQLLAYHEQAQALGPAAP